MANRTSLNLDFRLQAAHCSDSSVTQCYRQRSLHLNSSGSALKFVLSESLRGHIFYFDFITYKFDIPSHLNDHLFEHIFCHTSSQPDGHNVAGKFFLLSDLVPCLLLFPTEGSHVREAAAHQTWLFLMKNVKNEHLNLF